MAQKNIELEGIGTVTLYKRRGARNIKLTIGHNGNVRVTLPMWAPYRLGTMFAEQKREWLLSTRLPVQELADGAPIGKAHRLVFDYKTTTSVNTRVTGTEVRISMPLGADFKSPTVQTAIRQASVRALKKEAKTLLPQRLAYLAKQHGFEYRSVKIKEMRGRWGSCSQHKDIVLNCYLMQLPWNLIDYVILHELVHTRVLAHGKPFWSELGKYVPELTGVRKTMRAMQPNLKSEV